MKQAELFPYVEVTERHPINDEADVVFEYHDGEDEKIAKVYFQIGSKRALVGEVLIDQTDSLIAELKQILLRYQSSVDVTSFDKKTGEITEKNKSLQFPVPDQLLTQETANEAEELTKKKPPKMAKKSDKKTDYIMNE